MARRAIAPSAKERAAELRSLGYSNAAIAREIGIRDTTVHAWLGTSVTKNRAAELKARAIQLRKDGLTNRQIQEKMGLSSSTVWQWIGPQPKSYRIDRRNAYPEEIKREAMRLRKEEKLSNLEIKERLGLGETTVYTWLGKSPPECLEKPRRDYSGMEYHSRAMYLRECGYTVREISSELGIPRSTVGGWIRGYGCYGQNNGP